MCLLFFHFQKLCSIYVWLKSGFVVAVLAYYGTNPRCLVSVGAVEGDAHRFHRPRRGCARCQHKNRHDHLGQAQTTRRPRHGLSPPTCSLLLCALSRSWPTHQPGGAVHPASGRTNSRRCAAWRPQPRHPAEAVGDSAIANRHPLTKAPLRLSRLRVPSF